MPVLSTVAPQIKTTINKRIPTLTHVPYSTPPCPLSLRRFLLTATSLLCLLLTTDAALALDGVVLDSGSKKPIPGAMVTVNETVSQTDEQGRYHFDSPADLSTLDGKQVLARAIGYGRAASRLTAGSTTVADILLAPQQVNGLYLSFYGIGSKELRHKALDLIEQTKLNALVIDIKSDKGMIPYPSNIALAQEIGARTVTTVRDMPAQLQELKAKGIYLIARIVVFKDDPLAKARPELAVKKADGRLFRDREGLAWVDPSMPEVWQYNIDIAAEAAAMGFDEIQFDYVRFPDTVDLKFAVENKEANRVAAITGFLGLAHERLKSYNVFLSADIFGYVVWNENDTFIGQTLAGVAANVDYLCPMLYPSGFMFGIPNYRNPVAHSYEIVNHTLTEAIKRSKISPLRYRPWLQAFKDYAFDKRKFEAAEVSSQIKAAEDAGSSGWLLWNPRNAYTAAGIPLDQKSSRLVKDSASPNAATSYAETAPVAK